jgi:predicted SnoaL-like aldol condensation-catalyzing enzyme
MAIALMLTGSPALAGDAASLIPSIYAAMEAQPLDKAALGALFADSYIDHNRAAPPGAGSDKDAILGLIDQLNTGMPDGKRTMNAVETLSDGRVMVHFTFDGINTGQFFGMAASGNKVHFNGFDLFRIKDGQVAEQWHVEEVAALQAQLAGK